MKHYFKNDMAIDEDIIGVLEDSIKCNPNLDKDEQDALVGDLLYSQPYEVKDLETPRYTFFKANYQQVNADDAQASRHAPELLEALKLAWAIVDGMRKPGINLYVAPETVAKIESAIQKAEA